MYTKDTLAGLSGCGIDLRIRPEAPKAPQFSMLNTRGYIAVRTLNYCVTKIEVNWCASCATLSSNSKIMWPGRKSRFPVGSSASNTAGLPTSARAKTTALLFALRVAHPERCDARAFSPTSSNLASASEAASSYAKNRAPRNGIVITFSKAVNSMEGDSESAKQIQSHDCEKIRSNPRLQGPDISLSTVVYRTLGRSVQTAQKVQQCGLARSRFPHQRQHLARLHIQIQPGKNRQIRRARPVYLR